jgi:2,4'-dihydroxyacetophenone dioxygenase
MHSFRFDPAIESLPWQPVAPGFHRKLLRGGTDRDVRVQLLRLEPGTVIARHRHDGEVHALNIAGSRKLLDTGEIVGPGGYVYEPAGNIDSWMAVGDTPVIVYVTAAGALEYIDDRNEVISRTTTSGATADYGAFVASQKLR